MLARVRPRRGACAFNVRRRLGLAWWLRARHHSNGDVPNKFHPRHPPPGCPHAPAPLRHLPAPARVHRRTHAHEPHLPTADAHGTARPPQPGPSAGRGQPDPGGRPDPDRGLPERVKRMVGKVLTGNGITRCERGTYALVGGDELSDAERDQLLELCRQRLDAFHQQRGGRCLPTAAATAPRSAARSNTGCSPAPKAAASAAAPMRTKGPWRWTTSCPGARAAPTTSATCRPSASSAMLASATPIAPTCAACRPATPSARRAACSARWRAVAGCCWRTNWRRASPMPTR
jgi:hypothetical protein